MYSYRESEEKLFNDVAEEISSNAKKLIYSLNDNWRTLGVDDCTRHLRTEEIIKIVQERYDEVLEETMDKIKLIKIDIENLQRETLSLKQYLSIDSQVTPFEDDMPLKSIKDMLEKDLDGFRLQVKTRKEKIAILLDWQKKLVHLLGCTSKDLLEFPLPSESNVQELSHHLAEQQEVYDQRFHLFLEKKKEMSNLLTELDDPGDDLFLSYIIKSTPNEVRLTDQNMEKLDAVYDTLCKKLHARKTEVLELREKLALLWERLEESPKYQACFLEENPGHSRATLTALIEELQRCEEKKRQSFKLFVSKVRNEIVEMWDKCFYSQLQREKFMEFHVNIFNEDLLMLHEIYLNELKEFYKGNKVIFEMYAIRQQLWIKWSELEARANEPGRFNNRGGQLLREEKERKAVSNQLPKVEAELTQLLEAFETKTGNKFTINGQNLLDCMQEDWNNKNAQRQNKASSRKQGPASVTMSAPRSAPSNRQPHLLSIRATQTCLKRRLSPRQSPQVSKNQVLPRRLHLTPASEANDPMSAKRFKATVPRLAVNANSIKKRKLRRSQESKHKRRSRRSQNSTKSTDAEQQEHRPAGDASVSYITFQDDVTKAASRSSVLPEKLLRSHTRTIVTGSSYTPDGQATPKKLVHPSSHNVQKNIIKENVAPFDNFNTITPKKQMYATNTFGVTPSLNRYKPNTAIPLIKVENFATPKPVGKPKGGLTRQNTVTLASPSPRCGPMLRSSSSHNLRALTPTPTPSPKLHLASKLPLIL